MLGNNLTPFDAEVVMFGRLAALKDTVDCAQGQIKRGALMSMVGFGFDIATSELEGAATPETQSNVASSTSMGGADSPSDLTFKNSVKHGDITCSTGCTKKKITNKYLSVSAFLVATEDDIADKAAGDAAEQSMLTELGMVKLGILTASIEGVDLDAAADEDKLVTWDPKLSQTKLSKDVGTGKVAQSSVDKPVDSTGAVVETEPVVPPVVAKKATGEVCVNAADCTSGVCTELKCAAKAVETSELGPASTPAFSFGAALGAVVVALAAV